MTIVLVTKMTVMTTFLYWNGDRTQLRPYIKIWYDHLEMLVEEDQEKRSTHVPAAVCPIPLQVYYPRHLIFNSLFSTARSTLYQ